MAQLKCNERYLGFRKIVVVERDYAKSWKPAAIVSVTLADGAEEEIPAATPFFTFVTNSGELTVSAATCGHIHDLHISGTDLGSRFSVVNLGHLFEIVKDKIPNCIAGMPGISSFALDTGRLIGHEGLAKSMELVEDNVIDMNDVAAVERHRPLVYLLNKAGHIEAKKEFISIFRQNNLGCRIQFEIIRGSVIVPVVIAPMRPTKEVFMVFGPTEGQTGKALYTAAPGRWMPRHPNPSEFTEQEGGVDGKEFRKSLNEWFTTVMLK